MMLFGLQEEIAEDCRSRLQSQLKELEWSAWLAGNPALLYCGACQAPISSEKAMEGPMQDWPYCPVHPNRPLTVRSASRLPG